MDATPLVAVHQEALIELSYHTFLLYIPFIDLKRAK